MTLKWPSGFLVNIYHYAIGVAREIDPNVHVNHGHFFVDLRLDRYVDLVPFNRLTIAYLLLELRLLNVRP